MWQDVVAFFERWRRSAKADNKSRPKPDKQRDTRLILSIFLHLSNTVTICSSESIFPLLHCYASHKGDSGHGSSAQLIGTIDDCSEVPWPTFL